MQLALINKKMNKLIKGHFRKYATNAFIFRVCQAGGLGTYSMSPEI